MDFDLNENTTEQNIADAIHRNVECLKISIKSHMAFKFSNYLNFENSKYSEEILLIYKEQSYFLISFLVTEY